VIHPQKILILCVLAMLTTIAGADPAPKLSLKDLHVAARHGTIVVLNFWATWCEPCQDELPRLSRLAQSYAGKNVQFIAVSIDDAKDRARSSRCCSASTSI
jgi:thiol-disulfide isomerase/thioredoxin